MAAEEHSARRDDSAVRSTRVAPPRRSLAFVSSLRDWGGGEKWLLGAAVAMQARGHRVVLIAQPGSALAARGQTAGLAVRAVRLGGWLAPHSLLGLARALRQARVEVVCANLDKEIRQSRLAALLAGRRIRLVGRRGSPDPIKDNWHYRWVYNRGVDRLICNCEALIEPVCGAAPWFDRGKVRVIYNGIDADEIAARAEAADVRAELGIAPSAPVAACVGEVGWRKGQQHVLEAAAALREQNPDAVWLLVGEGDGRRSLQAEAAARGLSSAGAVRFLGFRRDVPAVLAAADLALLPSRREGLPNALLEAMALGLPVAASRADGIPELVLHGETGLLHEVDDQAAFIRDVARLLGDPALRWRLGEAGRRRARTRFAAPVIMDGLEDCLCRW